MQFRTETTPADGVTVWISQDLMQTCMDGASRFYSMETGGTFMGWWVDHSTAVVTAVVGPGPDAHHSRHHFEPDQIWQLAQIAKHYEASDRRETYLGDWHSHPDAMSGSLSWTDRCVLRRIIGTRAARCSEPLMAVLWGAPDTWKTTMWYSRTRQRSVLWDKLVITEATLKLAAN